jgi:hypothetical protein
MIIMIRYRLHFCLLPPKRLSERAEKAWNKEHDALVKPLVDKVTGLGDCWVVRTPVEWFHVEPSDSEGVTVLTWNLRDPLPSKGFPLQVRADRMKAGVHVAGWTPLVYVSERFKSVVHGHGLTGIEFVWCPDIGKYRAAQWYYPVCRNCLGRGLDHFWIDSRKLGDHGAETLDPRGRHGQFRAGSRVLKTQLPAIDPLVKELCILESLRRRADFANCFYSFHRYLWKHLPETDFAGTIEDWDSTRQRGLAMNRKAWELLRANRVITDAECRPVLTWIERRPGPRTSTAVMVRPSPRLPPSNGHGFGNGKPKPGPSTWHIPNRPGHRILTAR